MKIAVLGGSFNPLHIGHLALAEDVCVSLGYDKLFFIPVHNPPHKEMNDAESDNDRLAMVQQACAGDNRFAVERCELDRGGISYTYDTICFLEKKYAGRLEEKIGLVMGFDLAAEFKKWYMSGQLAQKTDIILAARPDPSFGGGLADFANHPTGAYSEVSFTGDLSDDFEYPHVVLENPVLPISSTEIRARIAQGKSWRYLVPEPVYRYIIQRKLYGYKR